MGTYFDAIVALICLIFIYLGFRMGALATILYLTSGFVSILVARKFSAPLGLSPIVVFGGCAALIVVLGILINRLLKALFLKPLDRTLGAVFGLSMGLILTASLVMPYFLSHGARTRRAARDSYSAAYVIPVVTRYLPGIQKIDLSGISDTLAVSLPGKLELKVSSSEGNK